MSEKPEDYFPRDKDTLIRDFTVANRLHDIQKSEKVKEQLRPKWWEAVVGIVQFATALGFTASLTQFPALRHDPYGKLLIFWAVLMVLSLIFGFEYMIFKLYHLRRAFDVQLRLANDLRDRIQVLEKKSNGNTEKMKE